MAKIEIQYFAILREQSGCSEEAVETNALTPTELYEELKARHGFTLPGSSLRVAIRNEFAAMDRPLKDGDTVAFIAPVAGG
jgi:molybdopterin converting factor subunit 1